MLAGDRALHTVSVTHSASLRPKANKKSRIHARLRAFEFHDPKSGRSTAPN